MLGDYALVSCKSIMRPALEARLQYATLTKENLSAKKAPNNPIYSFPVSYKTSKPVGILPAEGTQNREQRKLMKIAGIALIALGILALVYQGFTYTTREQDAKLGPVVISHDQGHSVWISACGRRSAHRGWCRHAWSPAAAAGSKPAPAPQLLPRNENPHPASHDVPLHRAGNVRAAQDHGAAARGS